MTKILVQNFLEKISKSSPFLQIQFYRKWRQFWSKIFVEKNSKSSPKNFPKFSKQKNCGLNLKKENRFATFGFQAFCETLFKIHNSINPNISTKFLVFLVILWALDVILFLGC